MTPPGLATDGSVDSPAERAVVTSLQALRDRVESMAKVIDALLPLVTLAQQAPAMAAMVGDSFDEVMRTARENGIDIERGLINGTGAALRFGATMDATKVRELEALLQSGVLDPAALQTMGELGRALTDTAASPPPPIGPLGLLKALGDPSVQHALGFLVTFAERFGNQLRRPRAARS